MSFSLFKVWHLLMSGLLPGLNDLKKVAAYCRAMRRSMCQHSNLSLMGRMKS